MPDMSSSQLDRISVLGQAPDGPAPGASEFGLVQAKPAARFSLRLDPDVASDLSEVAGFEIKQQINQLSGSGNLSMRLGPDEWLLIAEEQDAGTLAAELEQVLTGKRHSLVDISHRNIALILSGRRAADVLSTGCPLDFHSSAFPAQKATRTVFAKSEVIIAKTSEASEYRVECWRSFGRYLEAYLRNSARLLGIGADLG